MATNPNIYVSSVYGSNTGGTDTSKADPPQTGNITAMAAGDIYTTLEAAVNGAAPSDGDITYCTDDHAASYTPAANVTFNNNGSLTGVGLKVVSVDNLNIENYKPGASEVILSSTLDYNYKNNVKIAGVDLKGTDDTIVTVLAGSTLAMQDNVLTNGGGNGDFCIKLTTDGQLATLTNVELASTGATAEFIYLLSGGKLIWNGGKVSGTMPGALFATFGGNGGANAYLKGVDLSLLDKPFFPNLSAANSDVCLLRLIQCPLHASVVIPTSANLGNAQQRVEMFNSDDTVSNEQHRFLIVDGVGEAKNNDSVYVTANPAWYGGSAKSSIEVRTAAQASNANPFIFTLPSQYVDLANTSTDKVTINLVSNFVLTDTNIAAFLIYPDKTTAVTPLHITSGATVGAGNYGVDPIGAGTTLSASSLGAAEWTGEPASPNFYKMELDTVGAGGQATILEIRLEVYYPSIDGTTNKLFIDPLLEIGT